MDDPVDVQIKKMMAAGVSDDDIAFFLKHQSSVPAPAPAPAPQSNGVMSQLGQVIFPQSSRDNLAATASTALSTTGKLVDNVGKVSNWLGEKMGPSDVNASWNYQKGADWLNQKAAGIAPAALAETASIPEKIGRATANFIGAAAPMTAAAMASGGVLNPLTEAGLAAAGVGASGTPLAIAATKALSLIPGNAAGVAAFGPEELKTPAGIVGVLLPSVITGLSAFKTALKGIVSSGDVKSATDLIDGFQTTVGGMRAKLQQVGKTDPTTYEQVGSFLGGDLTERNWFERAALKNAKDQDTALAQFERAIKKDARRGKGKGGTESSLAAVDETQKEFYSLMDDYDNLIKPYRWTNTNPALNEPQVIADALTEGSGVTHVPVVTEPTSTIAKSVERANIKYDAKGDPAKTNFLSIAERGVQNFFDSSVAVNKISKMAGHVYNNFGSLGTRIQEMLDVQPSLPTSVEGQMAPANTLSLKAIRKMATDLGTKESDAFLKAKTTIANPDLPTGMALEDALNIVNNSPRAFHNMADEWKKFSDWSLDYRVARGMLKADTAEEMKQGFYTPLRNEFLEDGSYNAMAKRTGNKGNPTAPPFQTMATNTANMIRSTEKNYIQQKMLIDVAHNPELYNDIVRPVKGSDELVKSVMQEYVDAGNSQASAYDMATNQLAGTFDKSSSTMRTLVDGKLQLHYVHPDVARSLTGLNPLESNMLRDFLRPLSRPLREGVAFSNDISLIGPASDAIRGNAAAKSAGVDFNVWTDPIHAALDMIKGGKSVKEATKAGLNFGSVRGRVDAPYIPPAPFVERLTSAPIRTVANAAGDLTSALNDFIRPLNSATRLALYKNAVKGGMNPTEAASFANEALGNYTKMGLSVRGIGNMIEFGPFQLQNIAQDAKLVKRVFTHPKTALPVLTAGFTGVTLPSILAMAASHGDDKLTELRKADNYDNIWVRNPYNKAIYKIKRPGWGLAPIFGALPEMLFDKYAEDDPDATARMVKTIKQSYGANFAPISVQTVLGLALNMRDPLAALTGGDNRAITPQSQVGMEAMAQGGVGVSNIAHGISQQIPVSPYKVDYLLDKFLGPAFSDAVKFPGGKMDGTNKVPIFGRYSVSPNAGVEGQTQFYRDIATSSEIYKTAKRLAEDNKPNSEQYVTDNQMALGAYRALATTQMSISKAQAYINHIARDDSMSPEEKQAEIKTVRSNMNEFFAEYSRMHKTDLREINH